MPYDLPGALTSFEGDQLMRVDIEGADIILVTPIQELRIGRNQALLLCQLILQGISDIDHARRQAHDAIHNAFEEREPPPGWLGSRASHDAAQNSPPKELGQ